jgi:hypothetical protein
MYKNNLVVAIKANNKVLREEKDTVFLPFGTEYSILIKNLESKRVQVRVSVDGQDATEKTSLVIPANSEVEFKRFIKNGNMESGNSFKFIERTEGIEKHRGTKVDDGMIRIEYQFEEVYTPAYYPNTTILGSPYYDGHYGGTHTISGIARSMTTNCSNTITGSIFTNSVSKSIESNDQVATASASVNDVGITVPGSFNDQKFTQSAYFAVENTKHVMVLNLKGIVGEKQVVKPVTVDHKPICQTCGRQNKVSSKFCSECGTSLAIW